MKLDTFTKAYIQCAVWSEGEDFTEDDLSPDTLNEIVEDCRNFQTDYAEDIEGREEQAGHDFYLTRNRHGAGFWDGNWPEDVGKRLTEAAHVYGTFQLYYGDDGKLYHHN